MIITGLRNNCGKRWPSSKQKLEDQRPAPSVFWSTAASCKLGRESRQLPGDWRKADVCRKLLPVRLLWAWGAEAQKDWHAGGRAAARAEGVKMTGPPAFCHHTQPWKLQTVRRLFALCLPSLMSFLYWILDLKMGFWERYFQSYLT